MNKRETAQKYIDMLNEESIIIGVLEKEISNRKRNLKNCFGYLRMGKKRGFIKKISKYKYEYVGETEYGRKEIDRRRDCKGVM